MKIKWFGHSCFRVVSEDGTTVVTDPFDESVGYKMPDAEADIVTTSHNHFDHNHIKAIRGNFKHISKPGKYDVSGVKIKGIPTFHDDAGGSKRGGNTIFVLSVDGMKVCHCGDLGHMLSDEHTEELAGVDILLLPVGGKFTINARKAVEVMDKIKPQVTIPMHYKTKVLDFPIERVDCFLELAGAKGTEPVKELEVGRNNIGSLPAVVVMDYR